MRTFPCELLRDLAGREFQLNDLTQNVPDEDVAFLDPRRLFGRHAKAIIGDSPEFASALAG